MVAMNARSTESANAASGFTGCSDFSEADDSPDNMPSLHSSSVTSINRTSAGTVCPSASRMTSPGTRSVTSTLMKCPSRRTTALWCTRECNAAVARSARYSLTKPRPMLAARMTPMMIACVVSPRKYETTAVAANSPSTTLRSCRPRTASAFTRCVRRAFGPYRCRRAAASVLESPSVELSSRASTSSSAAVAAHRWLSGVLVTDGVPATTEGVWLFITDRRCQVAGWVPTMRLRSM